MVVVSKATEGKPAKIERGCEREAPGASGSKALDGAQGGATKAEIFVSLLAT